MNTQETLAQMRSLKLNGMAKAYDALLQLPLDQHLPADLLLAQLIEAESLQRGHQKMLTNIKAAKFRYQAALEEINYTADRNIDKNTILDLREEIDLLKVNLQKSCLHIEELIRENTLKKRMNDARLNEVQQVTLEIKAVDNKNQRTNEENKNLAITVPTLLSRSRASRTNARDWKKNATPSVLS